MLAQLVLLTSILRGGRNAPFLFFLSFSYAIASQSPAELRIVAAKQVLQQNQQSLQAHNDLAAALCERASETGDPAYFTQADSALKDSIKIAPGDYSAQRIRVAILLGEHRWQEALENAKELNHRVPDDLTVWCLLAETQLAIGNYGEAQKAAQWALDLRQGNLQAYRPAAKLREVFGDIDGAIEFLNDAFRRTPDSESSARAFLLTEMARLTLLSGNAVRATDFLTEAFRLSPNFYLALRVAASVEEASSHFEKAVLLLGQRTHQINTADALYDFAIALEQAGRKEEAASAFHDFESQAVAQSEQPLQCESRPCFLLCGSPRAARKGTQISGTGTQREARCFDTRCLCLGTVFEWEIERSECSV